MIEADRQTQEEILKLAKDNNRMLHAMRRNAFIGGMFRVLFWIAVIIAPIWFYSIYLSPFVDSTLQTMNQIQGTGVKAQAQFTSFQEALKNFESKLPAFMRPKQH